LDTGQAFISKMQMPPDFHDGSGLAPGEKSVGRKIPPIRFSYVGTFSLLLLVAVSGRWFIAALGHMFCIPSDVFVRLPLPPQFDTAPPTIFNGDTMFFDYENHFRNIAARRVIGDLDALVAFIEPDLINTGQFIHFRHDG